MKHFNTYLKLKDFSAVYDFLTDENKTEDMHSEKYRNVSKNLNLALHNFLQDYNKEHTLLPFEGSISHYTHHTHFWNEYIDNKFTNLQEIRHRLDELFSKPLLYSIFDTQHKIKKEDIVHKDDIVKILYDSYTDMINDGDFKTYTLPDSNTCSCCGEVFVMAINKWKPALLSIDWKEENGKSKMSYLPAKPCFDNKIQSLQVEFTTGTLLLSDWFRIPEFTSLLQENYNVNSTQGRVEQVQYLLDNFNVLSVPSTGSAYIFRNSNCLIFGNYDEDSAYPEDADELSDEEFAALELNHTVQDSQGEQYTLVDRVNSGLRNVTIVEKEHMIELLAQHENLKGDKDKAKAILDDYLKNNSYEINTVQIEPGTYTLHFSGNWYDFQKSTTESYSKNFEPYFTLKNNQECINVNKPKFK